MVLYGTQQLQQRSDARALLAIGLREQYGLARLPELTVQPLGKPCFAKACGIEFNLSHSGTLALCGLDSRPLGVDIQVVKDWREALPRRVCSVQELDWLETREDRSLDFAVLWALKEARAKQSGVGLRSAIREIAVPLPGHWDGEEVLDGLHFRVFTGGSWAAASCGMGPAPAEILWRSLR